MGIKDIIHWLELKNKNKRAAWQVLLLLLVFISVAAFFSSFFGKLGEYAGESYPIFAMDSTAHDSLSIESINNTEILDQESKKLGKANTSELVGKIVNLIKELLENPDNENLEIYQLIENKFHREAEIIRVSPLGSNLYPVSVSVYLDDLLSGVFLPKVKIDELILNSENQIIKMKIIHYAK